MLHDPALILAQTPILNFPCKPHFYYLSSNPNLRMKTLICDSSSAGENLLVLSSFHLPRWIYHSSLQMLMKADLGSVILHPKYTNVFHIFIKGPELVARWFYSVPVCQPHCHTGDSFSGIIILLPIYLLKL